MCVGKKKNRHKKTAKRDAEPPPPTPAVGVKGALLWLALAGMIALVLCALESVKIAMRDGV